MRVLLVREQAFHLVDELLRVEGAVVICAVIASVRKADEGIIGKVVANVIIGCLHRLFTGYVLGRKLWRQTANRGLQAKRLRPGHRYRFGLYRPAIGRLAYGAAVVRQQVELVYAGRAGSTCAY